MNKKLRELIESKGIKQKWLAEQIGVSATTVSAIVSGKRPLAKSKALAIASVLNVELNEIYEKGG